MENTEIQKIADCLYNYEMSEKEDGFPYTGGTAEGAADFWVESYYANEPEEWEWGCTEEELIPIAKQVVELLVARGLPRS